MRTAALICEGRTVVPHVELACTSFDRMRGLLGRTGLGPNRGLFLSPAGSVHTWFMRFSLDLIFLDRHDVVCRIVRGVGPFRIVSGGWRAHGVVELEAGWLPPDALRAGGRVTWTPAPAAGP